MKRKILSLALCGCLVAGMFPAMALAEDSQTTDTSTDPTTTAPVITKDVAITEENKCGDNMTWRIEGETLIISGTGAMYDFDLFSNPAPWAEKTFTSVVVDTGVIGIGAGAFGGQESLTSVTLPDTLTTIGDEAFSDCTSLLSIDFPDSLTNFGNWAFRNTGLTQVNIPSNVTFLGPVFQDCTNLTSVVIPNGVEEVYGTFNDCPNLTQLTIPASVTTIDYLGYSYGIGSLFAGCDNLQHIIYQGTWEQWANMDIFSWTPNLDRLLTVEGGGTLPASIQVEDIIDNEDGTGTLTVHWTADLATGEVVYSGDIIYLPHWQAKSHLFQATSVEFTNGLTKIGVSTFGNGYDGSPYLKEIMLPASVTWIGDHTFSPCDALEKVYFGGSQEQFMALVGENVFDENVEIVYNYVSDTPDPIPTPEPTPTPAPTQKPEPSAPVTGGETTTQDKVEVTVNGDKAEATVGGVGIVLGNAGKVFEAGTTVTVEKITQGTIYDTVKKALDKVVAQMDTAAIFEFTATKDGKPVQPNGPLSVTFSIPEGLTASNLKLFYVSPDGKYEEVKITVDTKAGTVTANLTHFSTYVLANVARSANDGNGVPQTGDNSALTLYVCVLAMSMAGLTILLVNKRRA